MLKLIPDRFSFGLPRSAIGPKKWPQLFNQIAAEVEPITNRLIAYSRASGSLLDFALSSHWLLMIFFFVLLAVEITLVRDFLHSIENFSLIVKQ